MSLTLDRLLAQAADMLPATVALSPESVTVLLYASGFLGSKRNWLDLYDDPLDEITDADWDTIEKLTANAYREVMTPMIGLCFPLITGDVPDNCLLLDGSVYDRADYPALYDALDTVFRIDADTFYLPDVRSRTILGSGTGTGLSTYAVGETGGEENVTLSQAEMPSHYHTTNETQGLAVAPGELTVNIPVPLPLGTTNAAGGDGAHENRMPFMALPWAVIAL